MKSIYIFVIISLFFSCKLTVQNKQQGIYLTANDFTNNKISFSPIEGKKYKFHLNEFINNRFINIVIDDSAYQFYKDSVFGYRDDNGICYRFYSKNYYQIISAKEEIVLYQLTTIGGIKNTQSIIKYYFSIDNNTPVFLLTKWNLKQAFATNSTFHELLDMYFNNDDELINYDNFYSTYKLFRVLKLSNK